VTVDEWGITDGYTSAESVWVPTPPATRDALRQAMGDPPGSPPLWVATVGEPIALRNRCDVFCEDGSVIVGVDELPPDLPIGYHVLHPVGGGPSTRLIAAPAMCPQPPGRRWGWTVQLYAMRSESSWGIGDLGDLARFARWTEGAGGGVIVTNPLHAGDPTLPQSNSPYYASSRIARSILAIDLRTAPGASQVDLSDLAADATSSARRIDRDRVFVAKLAALERLFAWFGASAPDAMRRAFAAWRSDADSWPIYATLAELHGTSDWTRWPQSPTERDITSSHGDRVRFHRWCQWVIEVQLATAAASAPDVALVGDLAVGFNPSGYDGWRWRDVLALDCRVGAPPDVFNRAGQDWGLPPFVPAKLRAAHHAPFISTIRAALRHQGGLRIDHVMGLFRQYWIAPGGDPRTGAYVRFPFDELLSIIALEATRAGAFVIGEDLGTVEPEVPYQLARRGVLSTRLVWFEPGPLSDLPERAISAVTTHDLPTVAGVESGFDRAELAKMSIAVPDGPDPMLERLHELVPSKTSSALELHRQLAESPSVLVTATLEDALGVQERPNVPGTVDEWPNWRLALPKTLEQIEADAGVAATVDVMAQARPRGSST
jgi:4-alpha-glucanotransferase